MSTDDKCSRIFVELRTFPSGSVHDHRNGHFNPLAASVFRQSVCIGEFFVVHKTNFCTLVRLDCWLGGPKCAADPMVQSKTVTKNWLQDLFKDRNNPLYRQFSPESRDPVYVAALVAAHQFRTKQDQQLASVFEVRFGTRTLDCITMSAP